MRENKNTAITPLGREANLDLVAGRRRGEYPVTQGNYTAIICEKMW